MSDLAERPPRIGMKQVMLRWTRESNGIRSPLLRYGLSIICCAAATGLALLLHRDGIRGMELRASLPAYRHYDLVRRNWTFRPGGFALHGVLQLLFRRASFQLLL